MPVSVKNVVQQNAVERGVLLDALPRHVAVIMDGNGRWATERGEHRLLGHQQGYATLRDVLLGASQLGIGYLTVYAFSAENWRRPEEEVAGLMMLIAGAARAELDGLKANNVRVRIIGRLDDIPDETRSALGSMESETEGNTGITFTLAVNYGGRAEIVDACRRLMERGVAPEAVTEEAISEEMYCSALPDPDLMIRTAGEMRWSNFLIWQSAYAELFVTERTWPEFTVDDLIESVLHFQRRTRKFGGL